MNTTKIPIAYGHSYPESEYTRYINATNGTSWKKGCPPVPYRNIPSILGTHGDRKSEPKNQIHPGEGGLNWFSVKGYRPFRFYY